MLNKLVTIIKLSKIYIITNEKLPFTNIIIFNTNRGYISDMKGDFQIETIEDSLTLIFSYVGYIKKTVTLKANYNNIIILSPVQIELTEIKIYPTENPAHRIIKKAIENRNINNPEKRKSFTCTIYNKTFFTIDTSSLNIKDNTTADTALNNIRNFINNNHLFISESIIERSFMAPDKRNDKIIASKVAGLKNPLFSIFINQLQPFTFYDEIITIADKKYINPVSKGSIFKYNFLIEDTLFYDNDTVFIISFRPYENKNFDALQGLLYINSNTYAIQNVIARPFLIQKGDMNIKIQQQYKYVDNQQ